MQEREAKEELVEAYQKFMGSDDGRGITEKQFIATMREYGEKKLTKEELKELFSETDHDNDGVINFEDFVRVMMMK